MFLEPPDPEKPDRILPFGATEEQVVALMDSVKEQCEQVGLYAEMMSLAAGEEGQILLVGHFGIGDLAFSQRVQDPQQEQFDDQFRSIETDNLNEQAEDIRNTFRKKPDDSD